MPRIAAIVLNSVSHDARVLKEADSLAAAGWDVTVIGIRDNRCEDPATTRSSGVRIVRVAWKARLCRTIRRLQLVSGVGLALLVAAGFILLLDPVVDHWTDLGRPDHPTPGSGRASRRSIRAHRLAWCRA